ncbi:LysM peptidoglycan-binding domain-containing protein [Maridesulfovibrio ferrireducens]|uniref:LysM peptidoglycan-binding domain-containing protein n=1 Tax=Maridesulfovibrio ferrireducens TaxID=246191 RepID=UPI001A2C591B|nr:LysM peptidoglycan-binding domain-containing protein [Maridesulfovibrio ferrireducens]MBI9111109.1 LysM peptidoglycan-binding domain-containing protein [Maridesulfovibrio ferrireducens]
MKKLIWLAVVLSLMFVMGCAKKQVVQEEVVVVEETEVIVVEEAVVPPTPMEIYEAEYRNLPTSHVVEKGECLWWIAEYQQIYNDPFMWPLIYKANRDQIKNPDLIYAGQNLEVPRVGYSLDEVKDARKEAGASWKTLEPQQDAVVPGEMKAALGYL